ncbi:MAG: HEAT repeat domain-containing protein [Elusimicrobiota bacterium]|jgi:hypothetical protein
MKTFLLAALLCPLPHLPSARAADAAGTESTAEAAPLYATTSEERVKIDAVQKLRVKDDPANVEALASALAGEASVSVRLEIVRTLSSGRHVGARSLRAIAAAMSADLDHAVRREAALGSVRFPGGESLAADDRYLLEERNEESRADLCIALATAAAHAGDPEATRLLANTLLEDDSVLVRRAALKALSARKDRKASPAVNTAAIKDPDADIRRDAARLLREFAKIPRALPPKTKKAPAPAARPKAVKGKDDCPDPNGWCECSNGPILKVRAHCIAYEDCRFEYENAYSRYGYTCRWSSRILD